MVFFSFIKNGIRFVLRSFIRRLADIISEQMQSRLESQALLLGQARVEQLRAVPPDDLRRAEVKVFSQAGEDGIIQKLVQYLSGIPQRFVEFGVEDYLESNTRYLLMNNEWEGLVMDGNVNNISKIRDQAIYWRHVLTARHSFITRENVQLLLETERFDDELGLLSIDIDGNDYWVWETLAVKPWIVVCEYNSWFGSTGLYSIPYDPDFVRTRAHYSNLYFGASLSALCALATRKGYVFVGSNSFGTNAFFVRRDKAANFQELTAQEGYVKSPVRQSRDAKGALTFLNYEAGRKLIYDLSVFEFESGGTVRFGDVEKVADR